MRDFEHRVESFQETTCILTKQTKNHPIVTLERRILFTRAAIVSGMQWPSPFVLLAARDVFTSIRSYPHLSSYDKTTQTHTREPTVPTQEIVPAPNCHRVCSFPSVHRGRPGQFTIRLDGSWQIC